MIIILKNFPDPKQEKIWIFNFREVKTKRINQKW